MNMTISQWLNTLVPMMKIVGIVNQVLPAFIIVSVMILVIGYFMGIVGSETVFVPSGRLIVLFACIAGAPWIVSIGQDIANGLVNAIGGADPGLNWLMVNNRYDDSLALHFDKPFGIISKYLTAKIGAAPGMHLDKWADYIVRAIFILLTGLVAMFTVFLMQAMLIIQKLIMVFSKLLVPIWIACLSVPPAHGSAQNYLKNVVGVMCWPVGWAIVHVGTMAGLQALQPPGANASLGELILAFATLAVVCLWPVVGTIGAPLMIAKMVTSGTNFAQSMMGAFSSVAGQHASRGMVAGGAVTGALLGSTAGPAGAVSGAVVGSQAGGALALPIASATESAEAISDRRWAIPSSRSASVADAAIGLIKTRTK